MVFFFFLIGSLSLLWFITGLKMNKTDPNNEIEKIYPSYWHLITAIILIVLYSNFIWYMAIDWFRIKLSIVTRTFW